MSKHLARVPRPSSRRERRIVGGLVVIAVLAVVIIVTEPARSSDSGRLELSEAVGADGNDAAAPMDPASPDALAAAPLVPQAEGGDHWITESGEPAARAALPPATGSGFGGTSVHNEKCGSGTLPPSMKVPSPSGPIVFQDGFDDVGLGVFTDGDLEASWGEPRWENGIDEGRATVVSADRGPVLEVEYPAGEIGSGDSGAQWPHDFAPQQAAHLTFWLRFAEDFDFVRGGKLNGLAGGEANTGGKRPDGSDGWSGRVIWQEKGCGAFYVYHPDMSGRSGEKLRWAASFTPGRWHRIDQVVVINTPGKNDGVMLGWLDGRLVSERRDFRFRDVNSFAVDVLYFSTFFGGGVDSYKSDVDQTIEFDGFVVRAVSPRVADRRNPVLDPDVSLPA